LPQKIVKYKDAEVRAAHLNKLENVYQSSSNSSETIFIISDTSVKNNIATSVSHPQREHNIRKTVHHAMNISSTEAKLFTIRCDISQATQLQDVMQIAVVTDTIPVAKRIFDLFHYPYQLHSIIISYDLRKFFNKNFNNSITS